MSRGCFTSQVSVKRSKSIGYTVLNQYKIVGSQLAQQHTILSYQRVEIGVEGKPSFLFLNGLISCTPFAAAQ